PGRRGGPGPAVHPLRRHPEGRHDRVRPGAQAGGAARRGGRRPGLRAVRRRRHLAQRAARRGPVPGGGGGGRPPGDPQRRAHPLRRPGRPGAQRAGRRLPAPPRRGAGPVTPPAARPAPLRVPRRLRPGDAVAVIAPCGPVDPDRLARGIRVLEGLGLKVVTGRGVLRRRGYLAGTDDERAADLTWAWCDPDVRAVLCARGGYGATRLLDRLDWAALAAAEPKILLGSSDVTALHRAFAERLGVATCFGPMPACATLSDPE